jgi:hypothetical protein
MKRALYVLLIVISLGAFNQSAIAGGIPTIDIANLTQQLVQYLQQIRDYQELMNQTSTQTNQYVQMIRDYQQTMREYQSYLRQLQGVKHMIDTQDWLRLMGTIKQYSGKAKRSYAVLTMDPESETYDEDLDAVMREYGHVPRKPADVEAEARELGIWSEEYARQVREDYEAYQLMKDRLRMVSDNSRIDREETQKQIKKHAQILDNLGDESDLATQQAIAAQNLTIMKQLRQSADIQNKIMLNMANERAERAAQSAKYRDSEQERLRNRQPNELLGRDRWGNF